MRKVSVLLLILALILTLFGCGNAITNSTGTALEKKREEVVTKWRDEADVLGTGKFIEDAYKEYPDDATIANIYFFSTALYEYNLYKQFPDSKDYLAAAEEYAARIDPDYTGEFSEEMHTFVNSIIAEDQLGEKHIEATTQENKYNSLTNEEKKEICNYIQSRYDYYDKINGGYAGDKYTDTIMEEAAKKYGLSVSQIDIIWMNMYSY